MDIINIYGPIADESDIIIGSGDRNSVHSLLTYFAKQDNLQIRPIEDIALPSIIALNITYCKDGFYLRIKNTHHYINVDIQSGKAIACISNNRCKFETEYSIIDKVPRTNIMAGSLMSLRCKIEGKMYPVHWKVQHFAPANMIMILPLNWYDLDNTCTETAGLTELLKRLKSKTFKGYTNLQWCSQFSYSINCKEGELCGNCLGPCRDPKHICSPDGTDFVCVDPKTDFQVNYGDPPPTTGTTAAWIAVIFVIVISIILYFLMFNSLR